MKYPNCDVHVLRSYMFLQCCEHGAEHPVNSQRLLAGDGENDLNLLVGTNMPWELPIVKEVSFGRLWV